MQTAYPGQVINTSFDLKQTVCCDVNQVGQLFSNLLNNAITHGRKGSTITVDGASNNAGFKLTVSNYFDGGLAGIPEMLFQPFSRINNKPGKKKLGLGLFIASEIANAHGGTINVSNEKDKISFTVMIPHPAVQPTE